MFSSIMCIRNVQCHVTEDHYQLDVRTSFLEKDKTQEYKSDKEFFVSVVLLFRYFCLFILLILNYKGAGKVISQLPKKAKINKMIIVVQLLSVVQIFSCSPFYSFQSSSLSMLTFVNYCFLVIFREQHLGEEGGGISLKLLFKSKANPWSCYLPLFWEK